MAREVTGKEGQLQAGSRYGYGVPPFPEPGPSEAVNLGEPSEPRPAASVLLLRDRLDDAAKPGTSRLEVLMLKRSPESHFMPSVWVFPGGSLDPEDGGELDGLRACGRRELAEECGVSLEPDTELVTLSRWVTPAVVKVRFDTWFFLAAAPPGTVAEPDGFEMTDALWISPVDAVAACQSEEMAIVFPTLKQLEALVPAMDTADALAKAKSDPDAARIVLPKVIGDERHHRVVLPHEPDYPKD